MSIKICHLLTTIALVCFIVSCAHNDSTAPLIVKLKKDCYITPPLEPGRPYSLNWKGKDFAAPVSEALCFVPAGSEFRIDKFEQKNAGGWYSEFAVGKVSCKNKIYQVELNLIIHENAGNEQAITDEIQKRNNRFWIR